jgi:hypothetical protein
MGIGTSTQREALFQHIPVFLHLWSIAAYGLSTVRCQGLFSFVMILFKAIRGHPIAKLCQPYFLRAGDSGYCPDTPRPTSVLGLVQIFTTVPSTSLVVLTAATIAIFLIENPFRLVVRCWITGTALPSLAI